MFLFSYLKKNTLNVFHLMIFKSMFEFFLPFLVGMHYFYLFWCSQEKYL